MGIGIACMVGVVGLWSIVPILVKQLLTVFDPLTIAFLRSAQGAGFALALLYARGYGVRSILWSRWHVVGGMGVQETRIAGEAVRCSECYGFFRRVVHPDWSRFD